MPTAETPLATSSPTSAGATIPRALNTVTAASRVAARRYVRSPSIQVRGGRFTPLREIVAERVAATVGNDDAGAGVDECADISADPSALNVGGAADLEHDVASPRRSCIAASGGAATS